jgi:hypothetical protein
VTVTTATDLVVVGFGLRYVMKVDTTVGPTLKTVVKVRRVADGWPGLPPLVSMATHCSYQMLRAGKGMSVIYFHVLFLRQGGKASMREPGMRKHGGTYFPSNLQYAPGGHCLGPVYV